MRRYIAARAPPPGRLAQPSGFDPEDDFCGTLTSPVVSEAGSGDIIIAPETVPAPVEPPVSLPAEPRQLTEAEAALLPPDPFALPHTPVVVADDPEQAAIAAAIRRYGPDAAARAYKGVRTARGDTTGRQSGWAGRAERLAEASVTPSPVTPQPAHVADDGLLRAKIVMEGKKAEREISGARMAAHTAWDAWRNVDVFKVRDSRTGDERTVFQPNHPARHTQGARYVPSRDESGNLVMVEELCYSLDGNDEQYPDLLALREAAEAADRRVLELQDQVDIMRALNPTLAKRANR
jgi:hypothetical protein